MTRGPSSGCASTGLGQHFVVGDARPSEWFAGLAGAFVGLEGAVACSGGVRDLLRAGFHGLSLFAARGRPARCAVPAGYSPGEQIRALLPGRTWSDFPQTCRVV